MSFDSFKKTILFSFVLSGSLLSLNAQDLTVSLSPANGTYKPVTASGAWHAIQTGTTFNPSYKLPENTTSSPQTIALTDSTSYQQVISKAYTFVGYRVDNSTTNYTASELEKYLSSTESQKVSITAACSEKVDTLRTDYKRDVITTAQRLVGSQTQEITAKTSLVLQLYLTPVFSTNIPVNASSAVWSDETIQRQYTTEGGSGKWEADFYYNLNGTTEKHLTSKNLSISFKATEEKSLCTIKLQSIKCIAPDGVTDWTPASAKQTFTDNVSIWPLPSAEREASMENETYLFNNTSLTLEPIIKGGEDDEWTYSWSTAAGNIRTEQPSLEVSTSNRYLNSSDNGRGVTQMVLTATNKPKGISSSKSVKVNYTLFTLPQPVVKLQKSSFTGFSEDTYDLTIEVTDQNPPYYPINGGQEQRPNCYYIQNGTRYDFKVNSTSYAGTYTCTATVKSSVAAGSEEIEVVWNRQLQHSDAQYHPECQSFEYQTSCLLNVCPKPTADDVDLSNSDEYALAQMGYNVSLEAVGKKMALPGEWSYLWTASGSQSSKSNYTVRPADVYDNITGNSTYQINYTLEATYTLQNEERSSATVSIPYSITYCAIPEGHKTTDNVTTCVGLPTSLGIEYSGGYVKGWTTQWYDADGKPIEEIQGEGGSVVFNSDINEIYVVKSYKAELVNEYKGKTWFKEPLTFDINLYKRPTISVDKIQTGAFAGTVNLYGGDSDSIAVSTNGGYPDNWTYEWTFDDKEPFQSTGGCKYSTYDMASDDNVENIKINVRVTNNYQETIWADTTYTVNVNVWSKGAVDLNSKQSKQYIYGDSIPVDGSIWNETILSLATKGGYEEGWDFRWEVIDDPAGVVRTSSNVSTPIVGRDSITVINNTGEIQRATLRLTAQNTLGEKAGNVYTEDFLLAVYPKVNVSTFDYRTSEDLPDGTLTELYYGNNREIGINASGGNCSNFLFYWSDNYYGGTTPDSYVMWYTDTTTYYHAGSEAKVYSEDPQSIIRYARVRNYSPDNNELWFEHTYAFPFTYYSTGIVMKNSNATIYLYGGSHDNETSIGLTSIGGYPSGYQVEARVISGAEYFYPQSKYLKYDPQLEQYVLKDEIIAHNGNNYNLDLAFENTYPEMTDGTVQIEVVWKNMIDAQQTGSSDSFKLPKIIVTPGAVLPEDMSSVAENLASNPHQVRDIDPQQFSVSAGRGGYNWTYNWLVDNQYVTYGSSQTAISVDCNDDSNTRNITNRAIKLHWYCLSPDGTVWEEGDKEWYLAIYNTPARPTKLLVKGNGTSNIYIADMSEIGISQDLIFTALYDYTLQFGQGSSAQAEAEENTQRWHQYASRPTDPWVRSYWRYDDGYDCYSDMVDTSGNTRSVLGIESVSADVEQPEHILVLRLNGSLVKTADHDLDLSELPAGTYLVKNTRTGESRKIMIK